MLCFSKLIHHLLKDKKEERYVQKEPRLAHVATTAHNHKLPKPKPPVGVLRPLRAAVQRRRAAAKPGPIIALVSDPIRTTLKLDLAQHQAHATQAAFRRGRRFCNVGDTEFRSPRANRPIVRHSGHIALAFRSLSRVPLKWHAQRLCALCSAQFVQCRFGFLKPRLVYDV
jgi:hypothetical protein